MESPPQSSRQESRFMGLRMILLVLVLILRVGTTMTAATLQMLEEEEFGGEGEHSEYENLVELGRRVAEGPTLGSRLRRSQQRLMSSSNGGQGGGADQPCLVRRSCDMQSASGNVSSKEARKRFRVDSIKDEILRKLRMDSAPNATRGSQREVNSMQQFFSQHQHESSPPTPPDQTNTNYNDEYSTPVALIVQSQTVPRAAINTSNSCYFRFQSPAYQPNQIITAQLGIFIRRRHGLVAPTIDRVHHLLVRRNNRRQQHGDSSHTGDSFRSKVINASNPHHFGRWHYFEVKTLVQTWINRPERNAGITVTVTDPSLQSLVVVQPRLADEDTLRPFIEVKVRPSSEVRVTRSAGPDCSESSQDRRCCRYPLTIDFGAFGWDWLMAPRRYEAYYCSGDCPFLYYQSNPHTHLLQQISPRSAAVPCCAPTQMSPLSIIYRDDKLSRIVYGSIPAMVVDRCGCA